MINCNFDNMNNLNKLFQVHWKSFRSLNFLVCFQGLISLTAGHRRKGRCKLMMKKCVAWVFTLLLIPSIVGAATWFNCSGDTLCGSSTQVFDPGVGNNIDLVSGQSSPVGGTNVWRWTYGYGSGDGQGIANVYPAATIPGGAQEMWVQWYYKYSPGFIYHGVMNKQLYFSPSNTMGMGISGGGVAGQAHINMVPQGPNANRYDVNVNTSSWYGDTGNWHKFKARYVLNTGSQSNGIYQAWVDDVMISNHSNVYYINGTDQFSAPIWCVIWGGQGSGPVPHTQYLYMAGLYIGSTDPGGGLPIPVPGKTPNPPQLQRVSP